jgi:hypothetical protein
MIAEATTQELLKVLGGDVHNLSVTHYDQLAILLFALLDKTLLRQQNTSIYLLLHLLNLNFAHRLYSLHI